MLTRWALEEIGFHRLEQTHATANVASCRMAAKTGFLVVGTKRGALLHADGPNDMRPHARGDGDRPADRAPFGGRDQEAAGSVVSCSASMRAFHSRFDACQPSSLWPSRQ
ncbi:GNAT family N-acetyltransferase [Streptomyces sp. bgisy159]|uniref:GNAT family N-acetyltransferase n=1 Tax=Streptomyces sp. bgisy159 TaxID=3413795 RepID=UPI003F49EF36